MTNRFGLHTILAIRTRGSVVFSLVSAMVLTTTVLGGFSLLICTLGGAFSAVAVSPDANNGTDISPSTQVTTVSPGNVTTPSTPTTPATVPPSDMSTVCEQLAQTFNSINTILPMSYFFEAGESMGTSYPSGKLVLDSSAGKLDGCISYQLFNSSAVIVHLEITENLELQFPQYEINGKNWTISFKIEGCHIVLHYSILRGVNSTNQLDLSVLMGEIKSLDEVTIISDYPSLNGRNFTLEAEDLIRPKLFDSFNGFIKKQLHWVVDPSGKDTSLDGFDAFKLIFKRQMIEISSVYKR